MFIKITLILTIIYISFWIILVNRIGIKFNGEEDEKN